LPEQKVDLPKIAVCASGEGTNFEALVRATRDGRLAAQVVGLIVNRADSAAEVRAQALQVPTARLMPRNFKTRREWDQAMLQQLLSWKTQWVALAGFLTLIGEPVLKAFPKRVINSHPALLPDFGGEGMYGERVHAAVLSSGVLETGVTVHLVDAEYDRGRILAQERVAVIPGDSVEELAARVKNCENLFYTRVLNDLVSGRLTTG